MMNNNNSENTKIKTLYAPGFSSLTMSYFKSNLVLKFIPYIGENNQGIDQYSKNVFYNTSLNPTRAAFFFNQASRILDGKANEPIDVVLPCNSGTNLTFEYKPDQNNNNPMTVYLTIDKNNVTVPFRFETIEYFINVEGQMVTSIIKQA